MHCELNYESSHTINEDLLDTANLSEKEQIHTRNTHNGERFTTYVVDAGCGSRIISVNGSAIRRAAVSA